MAKIAKFLYVRNWRKWQTYRNDRGAPPWIKVQRGLMRNTKVAALSDEQFRQLIHIWILAAERNGAIPNDPEAVRLFCGLKTAPDLKLLTDLGLLDAKLTPRRRQHDAPEAETETEVDKKKDKKAVVVLRKRKTTPAPNVVDFFSAADAARSGTSEGSTLQQHDTPAAPPPQKKKYAFEGTVVRLTQKDFDRWTIAFAHLNLRAELESRDAWLASDRATDDDRKRWFASTAQHLANREMKAKAMKPDGRVLTPGEQLRRKGIL